MRIIVESFELIGNKESLGLAMEEPSLVTVSGVYCLNISACNA